MLQVVETQMSKADEAIAIYEDSISYFMPATFEAEVIVTEEASDPAIVPYYEAA